VATTAIAPTKIHIAIHWLRSSVLPSRVAVSPYTNLWFSGSAINFWKSSSLSRSLPRNQLKMPIISTPARVDGMVIDSSVTKSMIGAPAGALARNAASETTATDTGLAMMPIWAPIVAAAIGRSGRMSFLIAMS
jgi:hypothetical protein